MENNNIAAIILGAGKGTRMESDLPKVMMPVAGKPMIRHIINTLEDMGVKEFITSEITYVANNLIELDEETTEKVMALSDALDEIDDVQNVYHNLSV